MAWLDAVRGVAVLLVLYAHLSRHLLQDARAFSAPWLHAGTAGVMLFFLVSGYIIPASLHRHGDLRAFWVSRLLRLFPLYLVVSATAIVLGVTGIVPLPPGLAEQPVTAVLAHATMLPLFLGVPLLTPVFWTLSFEMAFYLIVTAFFAVRRHGTAPRAEAPLAVALAVVAAVTAPLTPRQLPTGPIMVAVAAAIGVAGLAGVVSGRAGAVRAGGVTLGLLTAVLVAVNQDPSHVWDGLLILAVLFTGTVIYRADRGETSWWPVVVTGTVVSAALLIVWFAELAALGGLTPQNQARSVITLLVIGGGFGAAMALRHRRIPSWVTRAGVLSYSIYLVHYLAIQALGPVFAPIAGLPLPAQLAGAGVFVALLWGVCELTYRFVELPAQRLVRRGVKRPAATG